MQQFADYWLEAELARGGMGVVYRARHLPSGRACALKVVLSGNRASPAQIHRFKREALAQASLVHPHILRIFDGGEVEGTLYFSMELAEGGDLSVAEDWALPRKVEVVAKLARALGYAHEQGYVHRDLKPANVLMTPEGEPKLTDFGLTKRLDSTTLLTQEGALMGTPYYMSPEQAQGKGNQVGPPSDVFSLGVLLYHLVTGQLPFAGDTTVQLLSQIVSTDQDPLLNHGVRDPRLELILCKALEKDPESRYPDGTAVAEDLERWLRGEDPTASRASSFSRIAKKAVEHKTAASVIVLMVVASLLVVGAIGGAVAYAFARAEAQAAAARWRVDAKAQARELEQAASLGPDRLPALIAAREAARAHLAQEPEADADADPADREALEAALRAAWLRELEHALALGTVGGREHARASLDAAGAALPADDLAQVELRLRAAAGLPAEGWSTVQALRSADQTPSAEALEAALRDPATVEPARRAQGARLARAGQRQAARDAWAPLLEGRDPGALCALARVAFACGDGPTALAAYERALSVDPSAGAAGLELAGCAPRVGGFHAAKLALARAAATPDLDLARALLASERDPHALEADALPPEAAATPLLRADLQPNGAAPYAQVPGLSGRAAHARWLAEHGDPAGAREALAELGLLLGGPRPGAEPPPPLVGRALRDLAAAELALEAREPAAHALEGALRADPRDLEAHALRLRVEPALPAVADACAAAARAELATLDSALGRGVFLTRAARAAAYQREVPPPEVAAAAFLRRGTLGAPALAALLADLGQADPAPLASAWVPLVPRGDAEAREAAQARAQDSVGVSDEREKVEILAEAVALDPHDVRLRFSYARAGRRIQHSLPCYRWHVEGLAVAPYSALMLLISFRENWGLGATGGSEPDADTRAFLAEDPDDPTRQIIRLFCRYHALLYPDADAPAWGEPATPAEVIRALDAILARDARFYGLLFLRAHLLELADAPEDADRELKLAFTLGGAKPTGTYPLEDPVWGQLYQVWIQATQRPRQAHQILRQISSLPVERETAAGRLGRFLLQDPHMGTLREDPILERLLDNLQTR